MALTAFQREVCRLLAAHRVASGALRRALDAGGLLFHPGRIRGALPSLVDPGPFR